MEEDHLGVTSLLIVSAWAFSILILLSYKIQGTFRMASWRGIDVAVKTLGDDVLLDEEKV